MNDNIFEKAFLFGTIIKLLDCTYNGYAFGVKNNLILYEWEVNLRTRATKKVDEDYCLENSI
ncbi:hypothetical protein [Bacillus sp. TL12]|uniref:hypothetical protein n=1 Tax=Bacillus sp. TL12 TaxID=2894756 RepID=UPI001F51816A|nr:hypothetical protein [Bacillus sp. TL12]MCI0764270.1 hypothetical protein [Bacillus sp. TL12]